MRVIAAKDVKESELVVRLAGDSESIIKLVKGIKGETFIAADYDSGDFNTQAFYFPPNTEFSIDTKDISDEETKGSTEITFKGNSSAIVALTLMIRGIGIAGNTGHSFSIKTNKGLTVGWDGDGSDSVIPKMKVNGKAFDIYGYSGDLKKFSKAVIDHVYP